MKENATAILQPRAAFGSAQSLVPTTRVRAETLAGVAYEVVRTRKGARRFTAKDPVTGLRMLRAETLLYSAAEVIAELARTVARCERPFAEVVAAARAEWQPKLRVTYPAA